MENADDASVEHWSRDEMTGYGYQRFEIGMEAGRCDVVSILLAVFAYRMPQVEIHLNGSKATIQVSSAEDPLHVTPTSRRPNFKSLPCHQSV